MKRIAALVFTIALVLFAAGCSKSNGNKSAAATQKGTMDIAQAASSDTTVVYGRVDSIVGNEVTLALGEPQKGSDTASSSSLGQGGQAQTGTEQSGDSGKQTSSGERPSGNMGKRSSGEMPSGEMPSGEMPSGEMPSGASGTGDSTQSGTQGGRSVTLDYTGETATYLLPVGMAIGTGDFSDVTEGMVLSLTLSADSTITAVTILSR
jgi:hypothetical protein